MNTFIGVRWTVHGLACVSGESSRAPTIYCTISWLFVSLVRFSATLRPLCMTTMRFVTANTSGNVWLMRMTGTRFFAKFANQIEHLALLDDAKVVRRFVHDHEPRLPVNRPRNCHRLALAT